MSAPNSSTPLSATIEPYWSRLAADAFAFSEALQALAKYDANNSAGFNQPSAQDKAALKALAHWRRDARQLLRKVRSAHSDPHDKKLAERWLRAMLAAVDFQRQALSLADPNQAAQAARSAGKRMDEYFHLESRLEAALA
jgi:hypothetical protein